MPLFIVSLPDLPGTMRHGCLRAPVWGSFTSRTCRSTVRTSRGQSPGCRYEICRFEHDDAAIVADFSGLALQDIVRELHRRADIGQYVVNSLAPRPAPHTVTPVRPASGSPYRRQY
jgi:hypothetical protein